MATLKLRVGDTVIVTRGGDKGKTGKITAVHPRDNQVTVEGINVVKRHRKPTRYTPQGGVFELTKPIATSLVAILHPSDKKRGSRIGYTVTAKGDKKRVYRQASNKEIK